MAAETEAVCCTVFSVQCSAPCSCEQTPSEFLVPGPKKQRIVESESESESESLAIAWMSVWCVFLLNSYYYPSHYYGPCCCCLCCCRFCRASFTDFLGQASFIHPFFSTCEPSSFALLRFVLLIVRLYYYCHCHCIVVVLLSCNSSF